MKEFVISFEIYGHLRITRAFQLIVLAADTHHASQIAIKLIDKEIMMQSDFNIEEV